METFESIERIEQKHQKKETFTLMSVLFVGFALTVALILTMFVLPAVVRAADSTFSWLPNTEEDLAGYKIHYGAESGVYTTVVDCGLPETNAGGRVVYTIPDTPTENTFYAATAYDTAGQESNYSDEVSNNSPPGTVQGFMRVVVTNTTTITIE